METITKLYEKLSRSYINDEISELEFMTKVKHLKNRYGEIMLLKQYMVYTLGQYMTEACNLDDVNAIQNNLTYQLEKLKALLVAPTTISSVYSIPPRKVENYDSGFRKVEKDDGPLSKVEKDEHMKRVHGIIEHQSLLMRIYVSNSIREDIFIDEMTNAVDLNMDVYKDTLGQLHIDKLLGALPSYPNSTKWKVIRSIDVAGALLNALCTHEYAKHRDSKLQELHEEYTNMVKEAKEVADTRE